MKNKLLLVSILLSPLLLNSTVVSADTTDQQVLTEETQSEDLSIKIKDDNLRLAVLKGFKLEEGQPLTKQVIQSVKGTISVKVPEDVSISSLDGLEILQDIDFSEDPAESGVTKTLLNFEATLSSENMGEFDFSKLQGLNFQNLSLPCDSWGKASDQQLQDLANINSHTMHNLDLNGSPDESHNFNPNGMTNDQLAIIAPLIQSILGNDYPSSHSICLSDNCITDFSSLNISKVSKYGGMITGWYQNKVANEPLEQKVGSPLILNQEIKGMYGEKVDPEKIGYKVGNEEKWHLYKKGETSLETDEDQTTQILYGQPSYNYAYRENIESTPDGTNLGGKITFITSLLTQQPLNITAQKEDNNDNQNNGNNSSSGNSHTNNFSYEDRDQLVSTLIGHGNTTIYNLKNGKMVPSSQRALAPGTDWYSDRIANYKNTENKYYRVATNEWVKASDVYVYEVLESVVTTKDKVSDLLHSDSTLEKSRALYNNTSWKIDRIAYLGGNTFYRVATNEFVSHDDIESLD